MRHKSRRGLTPGLNGQTPTPGFYYHFKRDPRSRRLTEGAYHVLGIMDNQVEREEQFVVYLPLYEALPPGAFDGRPLGNFIQMVVAENGSHMLRYTRITDPKVIAKLKKISKKLYGKREL